VQATSLGTLGLSKSGLLSRPGLAEPEQVSESPLWDSFVKPPDDARIMMRWWWFGPAVSHEELEREMRTMKEGGIGGFEIQPVYPLVLDDPDRGIRNMPYLSDEFLDALRFVNQKADEFGMRLDLTLCSGWPYGGAKVLASQAAGMLRVESVPVAAGDDVVLLPSLESGETVLAAWMVRDDQKEFSGENIHELTELRGPRVEVGRASLARRVLFFISSRTGMLVKRAAVGAEGFVIDHYDGGSVEAYLQSTGDRLMQAFTSKRPYAVFSDSLEVFQTNWTPNLLSEFQKRRGYDLRPHLPALVADAGPDTSAIRCDWGRTLSELAGESYLVRVRQWANRHGTRLRSQNYGEPPVTLSSYRLVDLPEGENPDWRGFAPTRWAASACHLYGKPVTSAETWTWVHSPAFRATPLDLKAEADHNFLIGINQIVGHGWPYSPPSVSEPGWRFYAAGALNAHNPWWPVMPDLALYLQRVSFLLRQGKPANDVALYLSNGDAWARFTTTQSPSVSETQAMLLSRTIVENILDAGFNFDFIDDEAIERVGIPYRAIVLPAIERIPLSAYGRVRDFARGGGVVVAAGRKPGLAPGLLEGQRDDAAVQRLSRELFEAQGGTGVFVRDESSLGKALLEKLVPDAQILPRVPEIGFIHRKLDDDEIYFLANTGNRQHSVDLTFRIAGLIPESWDPFTATRSALTSRVAANGRVTVTLSFAPYESAIVVFSRSELSTPPRASTSKRLLVDLSRDWTVSFPELSKTFQVPKLRSWTEYGDLRFFSGRGIYEKAFSLHPTMAASGEKTYLSLGEGVPIEAAKNQTQGFRALIESPVREAAVVEVNGHRAGCIWHPPFELEVTNWLAAGENRLRIEVGNLAINAMAGESLPASRLLFDRYGRRATPQDMDHLKPLPSGLLGPISLITR
jgi:alpha-L-rhamnosidase